MNTWQILLCPEETQLFNQPRSHLLQAGYGVTAPSSGSLRGVIVTDRPSTDRPSPDLSPLLLVPLPGGPGRTQLCAAGGGLGPGPELGPTHVCSRSECGKGVSDRRSRFTKRRRASSCGPSRLFGRPGRSGARGAAGAPLRGPWAQAPSSPAAGKWLQWCPRHFVLSTSLILDFLFWEKEIPSPLFCLSFYLLLWWSHSILYQQQNPR